MIGLLPVLLLFSEFAAFIQPQAAKAAGGLTGLSSCSLMGDPHFSVPEPVTLYGKITDPDPQGENGINTFKFCWRALFQKDSSGNAFTLPAITPDESTYLNNLGIEAQKLVSKSWDDLLKNAHLLAQPTPSATNNTNPYYTLIGSALAITTTSTGGVDAGSTIFQNILNDQSAINYNIGIVAKVRILQKAFPGGTDNTNNFIVPSDPTNSGAKIPQFNNIDKYINGPDSALSPADNFYAHPTDFVNDYTSGFYDANGTYSKIYYTLGQAAVSRASTGSDGKTPERCGGKTGLAAVFNADVLNHAVCVLVDVTTSFINGFLSSSAYLLAVSSGVSDANKASTITIDGTTYDNSKNGFFVGVAGASTQGVTQIPFQLLMVSDAPLGQTVRATTQKVESLLNVILILGFIFVAIVNILQIQMNTYNIRKLVPAMIIGFILALASSFMIRAALEVSSVASAGIFQMTGSSSANGLDVNKFVDAFTKVRGTDGSLCLTLGPGNSKDATNCVGDTDTAKVFQQFVLNGFTFVGAILMFILGFLLLFRVVVFTILVPLSPLAVFSKFFPPLGFIWNRWFKTLYQWILMPVPISFCLLLSLIYFSSVAPTAGTNGIFDYIINYAAGVGFLFAAIRLPFTMAGDAKAYLDKYNSYGKQAWGATGGAAIKRSGNYMSDVSGVTNLKKTFAEMKNRDEERRADNQTLGPMNKRVIEYNKKLQMNTEAKKTNTKLRTEGIEEHAEKYMQTENQRYMEWSNRAEVQKMIMEEEKKTLKELIRAQVQEFIKGEEKMRNLLYEARKDNIRAGNKAETAEKDVHLQWVDHLIAPEQRALLEEMVRRDGSMEVKKKEEAKRLGGARFEIGQKIILNAMQNPKDPNSASDKILGKRILSGQASVLKEDREEEIYGASYTGVFSNSKKLDEFVEYLAGKNFTSVDYPTNQQMDAFLVAFMQGKLDGNAVEKVVIPSLMDKLKDPNGKLARAINDAAFTDTATGQKYTSQEFLDGLKKLSKFEEGSNKYKNEMKIFKEKFDTKRLGFDKLILSKGHDRYAKPIRENSLLGDELRDTPGGPINKTKEQAAIDAIKLPGAP